MHALLRVGLDTALSALGNTAFEKYKKISPNSDDPYYEMVKVAGRRRPKKQPRAVFTHELSKGDGVSLYDREILEQVCHKAHRLDQQFRLCCFSFRFGWSAILGLLPLIGDAMEVLLSLSLIRKASQVQGGLPKRIYARMILHIVLDFAYGFIPIFGDIADAGYRANTRNAWLLDSYLAKKGDAVVKGAIVGPDGKKFAIPPELLGRQEERDNEMSIESKRAVQAAHTTPAAVPPARMPAPKASVPSSGRSLTGQQARDPRDRK